MENNFIKYVYWLNKDDFIKFQERISEDKISIHETKKAVCVVLSRRIEIGFVHPDTWEKFDVCRRQMSWYKSSSRAGNYLIVSSINLEKYGLILENTVRESEFTPPALPDENQKIELIKRPGYQKLKPDEWENVNEDDPMIRKWLKVMGIRRMTYKELFVNHCANHANFIDPVYYIEDASGLVPYSISNKTNFICSACMEFFNILGSSYRKKFVVPCPGASLFAGLQVNKYYEVSADK
jgi:hypothetical protein